LTRALEHPARLVTLQATGGCVSFDGGLAESEGLGQTLGGRHVSQPLARLGGQGLGHSAHADRIARFPTMG